MRTNSMWRVGCLSLLLLTSTACAERTVMLKDNQLNVDGEPQPQQFGAELQYFRLRGGYGRNVPRAEVIALWNKALDRMVEAKMNAISFYIPWDFHEYAEGKFDFDGTVDEDGDGNPDYPSRDIHTFLRLVEEHGIHKIMVRPGPFINAEWGFLGFGAIPQWFHEKYPQSHMRTSTGLNRANYDYLDPDFLRLSKVWFTTLYKEVLQDKMGEGKPIVYLQIDNETNYQWTSIYNGDYANRTVERYRTFLKDRYRDLASVNRAHSRYWKNWNEVRPPEVAGRNLGEDQDWYRYSDDVIYRYLKILRGYWEEIGVKEPNVLFTLAESYNVTSAQNLLPNFRLRNAKGETGLMTVNLYPKVANLQDNVLFNSPFKADIDVKSADEANDSYLGSRQEWVLGPEVQGGWWRGTTVSPAARLQTYLTVIGHGMKAMFVYYFNEGQNWGTEWAFNQVKPLFDDLRREWKVEATPVDKLSNEFWGELQSRSDKKNVIGIDVRRQMTTDPKELQNLYFDAPLDGQAEPRNHFYQLKQLGENIVAPLGQFLARSLEASDGVALVRDSESVVPSAVPGLAPAIVQSDGAGGLFGYLANSGVNPQIFHGDLATSLPNAQVLVHLDTGLNAAGTIRAMKAGLAAGKSIVNFLAEDIPCQLGVTGLRASCVTPNLSRVGAMRTAGMLEFYLGEDGHLQSSPTAKSTKVRIRTLNEVPTYDLSGTNRCEGILFNQGKVAAYRCVTDKGTVVQVGADFFTDYNTDAYGRMTDAANRKLFLGALWSELGVQPNVQASGDRVVAFSRVDPRKEGIYTTVKTGSRVAQNSSLKFGAQFLAENLGDAPAYQLKDLLSGETFKVTRAQLVAGFPIPLEADGARVFFLSR